jgi:hypothetical protein
MIDTAKADRSGLESSQVVRVSRDLKSVVVARQNGTLDVLSASTGDPLFEGLGGYYDLPKDTQWRRVVATEVTAITAALASPVQDIEVHEEAAKTYRVPPAVKEEIQAALSASADLPEEDLRHARALAFDDAVSMPDVQWMSDFFDAYDTPQRLRGGFKGQKWASKILGPDDLDSGDTQGDVQDDPTVFDGDQYSYYGIGTDPNSTEVHTLIAVDFDTHEVLIWNGNEFEPTEAQIDDVDEPQIVPLDNETAQTLALMLQSDPTSSHDVLDFNAEERSLFALGQSELDYEDLDRRGAIIADATGYTPAERSLNAKRQIRGPGGTFGGRQVAQGSKLQAFKKAKLSDNPPLVVDVAARIQQFLADAQATDESTAVPATDPVTAAAPNPAAPTTLDSTSAPVSTNATADAPTGDPTGAALYFAIVDATDTTAVLDAIAIVKDSTGNPQAWVRTGGAWKNDPATLAKLTGPTPPPIIELTSPEPAKTVLAQVDASDGSKADMPAVAVPTEAPVTAAGFAVPGTDLGIYDENDIVAAVSTFDTLTTETQSIAKRIIRTRATALNRRDLLPVDWRTLSAVEEGEAFAAESPLFSEYGDVIVATGHPVKGAKGAEKLKEYWIHGKGALKIRWGTPGDLSRAHTHLAKFVGPVMAWGLAQNYHKALFGMSNAKHDKLTGQR